MGHVRGLRKFPMLKSVNLTDREFKIYSEVKFHNNFSTAIRKSYHGSHQPMMSQDFISETQEVESVFVFEQFEEVSYCEFLSISIG